MKLDLATLETILIGEGLADQRAIINNIYALAGLLTFSDIDLEYIQDVHINVKHLSKVQEIDFSKPTGVIIIDDDDTKFYLDDENNLLAVVVERRDVNQPVDLYADGFKHCVFSFETVDISSKFWTMARIQSFMDRGALSIIPNGLFISFSNLVKHLVEIEKGM